MAPIYAQTTAEADARLVTPIGTPGNGGFQLIRGWFWLAGAAASGNTIAELVTTMRGVTTYTDPKANNHTYTGTFVNTETKGLDEDSRGGEERTTGILQTLTLVTSVTNLASLPTPKIDETIETLNYLGLEEGTFHGYVYRYENLLPSQQATVMALNPLLTNYTIVKKEWKVEDDGTATWYVVFDADAEKWTNVSGANPDRVIDNRVIFGYENYDPENATEGLDVKKIDGGTGIPTSVVEEVLGNEAAEAGYAVDAISISEQSNGESTLRKQQTKLRPTTGDNAVAAFARKWIPDEGTQSETEILEWVNITADEATTIYENAKDNSGNMYTAPASPLAPTNHVLKSVERIPNANGSFGLRRETYIPRRSGSSGQLEETDENQLNRPIYNKGGEATSTVIKLKEKEFLSRDAAWDWIRTQGTSYTAALYPDTRVYMENGEFVARLVWR